MKLNLKNPLVFFDLETTGTNINSDRIVEICYLKVYPNGNEESKTMRINRGATWPASTPTASTSPCWPKSFSVPTWTSTWPDASLSTCR